jgi:hypothetical protein
VGIGIFLEAAVLWQGGFYAGSLSRKEAHPQTVHHRIYDYINPPQRIKET